MGFLVVLCSKTCAQPCGRPRQRMQCKHAGSEAYVNVPWTSSRRDHRFLVTNCRASDLRRHHTVSLVHFEYARVSGPLRRCLLQASTLNLCACVGVVQACHNCSQMFRQMALFRLLWNMGASCNCKMQLQGKLQQFWASCASPPPLQGHRIRGLSRQ